MHWPSRRHCSTSDQKLFKNVDIATCSTCPTLFKNWADQPLDLKPLSSIWHNTIMSLPPHSPVHTTHEPIPNPPHYTKGMISQKDHARWSNTPWNSKLQVNRTRLPCVLVHCWRSPSSLTHRASFQGVWTPCFFLMNVVRHTSIWVRGGGWGQIKLIKLNKIRGHLKSSHIADKRKSFHMALYPLPPSSNESVIDNGRNVRQIALRCRVQDYVKTCNRLSRPTKAFTKRSYSFKGVR